MDPSPVAEALFEKIKNRIALPFPINFKLIADEKQKKAVKIVKVTDLYEYLTGICVVLVFNNYYVESMDEMSVEILLQQEVDRLHCDLQSGKVKLGKPELVTSVGVIKKWGIDEVAKANKLEELVAQQKEDADKDRASNEAAAAAADLKTSDSLIFED